MNRTKQELEDRLLDYLYDEMPVGDRSAFVAEISEYPDLARQLERWQSVGAQSQKWKDSEFPPQLHAKLMAEAKRAAGSRAVHPPKATLLDRLSVFLMRPAFATAAVAVILAGVGLFYADKTVMNEPSPTDILAARPQPSEEAPEAAAPKITEATGEQAVGSNDLAPAPAAAPVDTPETAATQKWAPSAAEGPPAPQFAADFVADEVGRRAQRSSAEAEKPKDVAKKAAGAGAQVGEKPVAVAKEKKTAARDLVLDGTGDGGWNNNNQAVYGGVGSLAGGGANKGELGEAAGAAGRGEQPTQTDSMGTKSAADPKPPIEFAQKTAPIDESVTKAAKQHDDDREQVEEFLQPAESEAAPTEDGLEPSGDPATRIPAGDAQYHDLAQSYFRSNQIAAAVKAYDDLLANYPHYSGRRTALAEAVEVYLQAGQKQKAQAALAELESRTKDPTKYARLRTLVDGDADPANATTSTPAKPASKKAGPKQAAPPADSLETPAY